MMDLWMSSLLFHLLDKIKMNAEIENEQVLENCQKYLLLSSNSHIETNIRRNQLIWVAKLSHHLVVSSSMNSLNKEEMEGKKCETEYCIIKVLNNLDWNTKHIQDWYRTDSTYQLFSPSCVWFWFNYWTWGLLFCDYTARIIHFHKAFIKKLEYMRSCARNYTFKDRVNPNSDHSDITDIETENYVKASRINWIMILSIIIFLPSGMILPIGGHLIDFCIAKYAFIPYASKSEYFVYEKTSFFAIVCQLIK